MVAGTVTDLGSCWGAPFSWAKTKPQRSRDDAITNLITQIVAPLARTSARPEIRVLYNHQFALMTLLHSGGGLPQAEIGIIGGSGLYSMPGLTKIKEMRLRTPFGAPSDAYVCGLLEGGRVAFLARHGRGHRILPSELNFRSEEHTSEL